MTQRPIAVFDSGVGGLSVVRELRRALPAEPIVYFGDTARVPYGTKSPRIVAQFAREAAEFLLTFDPKLIVAACNTVSAVAMDALSAVTDVPVIGMVEPGARGATVAAGDGAIGVIGTEATIASGAYVRAIHHINPGQRIESTACPLFVPLAEEGRLSDDPIVALTAQTYLTPLGELSPKAVILGCTHYPLLREAIAAVLGPNVAIIDSGQEAAHAVAAMLADRGWLSAAGAPASMRVFVSDNPTRFRAVGSRFLGQNLESVELVDLEPHAVPSRIAPSVR
ncbi:MAG: glutamate racemase [Phycisphaerales bacterium]|nr:glutamate racemase [Phycisphaerales bacterium]